jgi:uncharacterized protein (UPF0332 family)
MTTPNDFRTIADWLLNNSPPPNGFCAPVGFRSSVSRAYYGAFHTAIQVLERMGITIPSTSNKHDKAPDILEHTEDGPIMKAAEKLKNLREERNKADYNLSNKLVETQDFARLRLMEADSITSQLNTFLTSSATTNGRFEKARVKAKKHADILFLGKYPTT